MGNKQGTERKYKTSGAGTYGEGTRHEMMQEAGAGAKAYRSCYFHQSTLFFASLRSIYSCVALVALYLAPRQD